MKGHVQPIEGRTSALQHPCELQSQTAALQHFGGAPAVWQAYGSAVSRSAQTASSSPLPYQTAYLSPSAPPSASSAHCRHAESRRRETGTRESWSKESWPEEGLRNEWEEAQHPRPLGRSDMSCGLSYPPGLLAERRTRDTTTLRPAASAGDGTWLRGHCIASSSVAQCPPLSFEALRWC